MSDLLSATGAYADMLQSIKAAVRDSRFRVQRAVNRDLIDLYWTIGHEIVQRQETEGWGKSVVERLSSICAMSFRVQVVFRRETFGICVVCMKNMPVNRTATACRRNPWGQNLLILNMVKDLAARLLPAHDRRTGVEPQCPAETDQGSGIRTACSSGEAT